MNALFASGLLLFLCSYSSKAVKQSPSVIEKIRSEVELGNHTQAENLLRDYLSRDRDGTRFRDVIQTSMDWDRRYEWQHSLWMFGKLAELYPNWPGAGLNHANYLKHMGEVAKAESVFQYWIGRFPNESALRNDLGLLYQSQGRYDMAETEFRESIRLGDKDAPANLCILWKLAKKEGDSEAVLREALRSPARNTWARHFYAVSRISRKKEPVH